MAVQHSTATGSLQAPCAVAVTSGGIADGINSGVRVIDAIAGLADDGCVFDVWFIAFPLVMSLDVVGPYEVFSAANHVADGLDRPGPRYRLRVIAASDTTIETESGLRLAADPIPRDSRAPHTLVVPGGDGVESASNDADLVAAVGRLGRSSDRLATVCSGAFLAAAAGLLDGRRVATHWARCRRLADAHPTLTVDPDSLHVHDGPVWSSAGVMAGVDLALAVVEHDHDAEVAQIVARWLVVHLRRPGGQSPFAAPVWTDPSPIEPIRQAQGHIEACPGENHTVDELARRVGLSPRHFSRLFTAELGEPPGRFVERVRVEAARRELESGRDGLAVVADRCGFGTSETLRRAFRRRLGVSPDDYRRRFHLNPEPEHEIEPEPDT